MLRSPIIVSLALAGIITSMIYADDIAKSPAKSVAPGVHLSQRASEIIGLTVKNTAGRDLGTVSDIVLDTQKGNIRYLAISYGGFLGLGDKLFAIPHQSFEWKLDDANKTFLVLNLTEKQLREAPGFNQNAWPDFANDTQWREKIDTYYDEARKVRP